MTNYWKTADIKISTGSGGEITAEHKYAGTLIEWTCYTSRAEARRDAVEILKEMKEMEICRNSGW